MDKQLPFFVFHTHREAEEAIHLTDKYVLMVHGSLEEINRAHVILANEKVWEAL